MGRGEFARRGDLLQTLLISLIKCSGRRTIDKILVVTLSFSHCKK